MKYNYLLQLLILIIFVPFYSCSQNIKNQNCSIKNLPYFNGTKGTVSKNATNVGVRNVSIDSSQNKFTLTATIFVILLAIMMQKVMIQSYLLVEVLIFIIGDLITA